MWRTIPLLLMFLLSLGSSALAGPSSYLIGDGDVLKVAVYDNPDLDTVVRVSSEGTIMFPLLGEVEVGGMSVVQVSEVLGHRLADGYIVNPQVSVFIEQFRSKKVIIIGQVRNPGLYELSGPTTLLELISKAGGLGTEVGERLTIKRRTAQGQQAEKVITVNLVDLLEKGETALDVPIQDGDNIFIPKGGMFYVTGEIQKPDAYRHESGTSVLKAITMAGGFTPLAARGKVKIIRKVDGGEQVLVRVGMDAEVLPEDVIVVPESFF